jgi:hypothetical protein
MKYQLLDSGNLQKLEQVGEYRLIRPALNAFWRPELSHKEWDCADAVFTRDSSGGGRWHFRRPLPESWVAQWGGFSLKMKPTNFGHLGFFGFIPSARNDYVPKEQYDIVDVFAHGQRRTVLYRRFITCKGDYRFGQIHVHNTIPPFV